MKAYTDLNQSKKIAEILPLESADMYYPHLGGGQYGETPRVGNASEMYSNKPDIPCWSLAALLNVLPTLDDRNANFCKDIRYDKWHVYYHSTATLPIIDTDRYENLVDACYEMIIKLHELKML